MPLTIETLVFYDRAFDLAFDLIDAQREGKDYTEKNPEVLTNLFSEITVDAEEISLRTLEITRVIYYEGEALMTSAMDKINALYRKVSQDAEEKQTPLEDKIVVFETKEGSLEVEEKLLRKCPGYLVKERAEFIKSLALFPKTLLHHFFRFLKGDPIAADMGLAETLALSELALKCQMPAMHQLCQEEVAATFEELSGQELIEFFEEDYSSLICESPSPAIFALKSVVYANRLFSKEHSIDHPLLIQKISSISPLIKPIMEEVHTFVNTHFPEESKTVQPLNTWRAPKERVYFSNDELKYDLSLAYEFMGKTLHTLSFKAFDALYIKFLRIRIHNQSTSFFKPGVNFLTTLRNFAWGLTNDEGRSYLSGWDLIQLNCLQTVEVLIERMDHPIFSQQLTHSLICAYIKKLPYEVLKVDALLEKMMKGKQGVEKQECVRKIVSQLLEKRYKKEAARIVAKFGEGAWKEEFCQSDAAKTV